MVDRYRPRSAAKVLEPDKAGTETPKKVRGRPFRPGNPGRPPGSKNQTTRLLEQLMAGDAEKVVQKAVELALAGNVRCLQLCLDRLLPRRTGRLPVAGSQRPARCRHSHGRDQHGCE
jgi:hypothetical protein